MKIKFFLFSALLVLLISSCDNAFIGCDVEVDAILEQPDKITIYNDEKHLTLDWIKLEIDREGKAVYTFRSDDDIPSGKNKTFTLENFKMQDGDKCKITDITLVVSR